jgi:DNA-binding transcriptional MerR regulator
VQILQLLEQGFTHRQIAEMIRDNFDNLQASDAWNADKKEYTFLSTPLQKPAREESELVRDFQQRTNDRYDAVKEVVGEFLHRK